MTEQVTFKGHETSEVTLALQSYAIYLENKGLYASAAAQWKLAAKAARATGWPHHAINFSNNAKYCEQQCLQAA